MKAASSPMICSPAPETKLRCGLKSTTAATVFSTRWVAVIIPTNGGARTWFHIDMCLHRKQNNSAATDCSMKRKSSENTFPDLAVIIFFDGQPRCCLELSG
jgi:hypothetical protein